MKVVSTPFSGMLSSVAVKDCKETLAANIVKVDDKGVRVFHCAPGALLSREAEAKYRVVCGMTIQDLSQKIRGTVCHNIK
jgi:hypothetical protein